MRDPRLEEFADLGRVPWTDRLELIHKQFPSVARLDWRKAFEADMGLFARIVEDILKLDAAEPGRPGPRPGLDYSDAATRLRRLWGVDFANLPFPDAFKALALHKRYSLTVIARKTNVSRSKLHRFMKGLEDPSAEEMETIAEAFGKHPSYFAEWRAAYVLAMLAKQLEEVPEASVGFYRKVKQMAEAS